MKSYYFMESEKNIKGLLGASFVGDIKAIKLMIESQNLNVNVHDLNGLTALHNAALKGHLSIVEYLLLKGANIDCKTKGNQPSTPLAYAIKGGSVDVIKILIEKAKSIGLPIDFRPLLWSAAEQENVDILDFLMQQGINVNDSCRDDGAVPLHSALISGKHLNVQLLLNKGADYWKCSNDGFSPLHFATKGRKTEEAVKVLLNHVQKIDGNERLQEYINYNGSHNNKTALHFACLRMSYHTVKLLIDSGADCDITDKDGLTPYQTLLLLGDESYASIQIRALFTSQSRKNEKGIL